MSGSTSLPTPAASETPSRVGALLLALFASPFCAVGVVMGWLVLSALAGGAP